MVRQQPLIPTQACWCLDLQTMDYSEAWEFQQAIVRDRIEKKISRDIILLIEHTPVFTLGRRGGIENLTVSDAFLKTSGIQVIQVERGVDITYHGPGQIVVYPLIDIGRLELGVRKLVTGIEQVIIDVLQSYGVDAQLLEGAPGVYIDGVKIASLGLRIRKGKSFHGLSFNINMDLEPFQRINPCGYEGLQVTNLSAFTEVSIREVEDRLIAGLSEVLGYNDRFRQVADSLP